MPAAVYSAPMGDGDGWARCGRGHVHWGRHGAAGLLAFHRESGGELHVLLQQRAWWCNGGGTWGLFGGGRHSHEDEVTAALRETAEECSLDVTGVRVHGFARDDHGGWDFTTVFGSVSERTKVRPDSFETRAAAWVPVSAVEGMRLFPPFAASWSRMRDAICQVRLVVDGANVVGSRPDGWWRDRAGAAARLRDRLTGLAAAGLAGSGVAGAPGGLPSGLPSTLSVLSVCYPEIILVVEGAARPIATAHPTPATGPPAGLVPASPAVLPAVRVVAAERSGDDAIVELVSADGDDPHVAHLVVTADRELRDRCAAAGAVPVGPRWLLDRLDRLDRGDSGARDAGDNRDDRVRDG